MRLIDADALFPGKLLVVNLKNPMETAKDLMNRINTAPTIDAVPVVRCEECKHLRRNLENDTYCDCVGGLTDPEEHDFCSYGERRSDA